MRTSRSTSPAVRGTAGRATIHDVARQAGVGTSTVSRVLNGGQVSEDARRRVQQAIGQLEYRPHPGARALAAGPAGAIGAIGVVIPFFTSPSAIERLSGVLDVLDQGAYDLLLCNVADPSQRDVYLARHAPLDRVDGLLLISLAPHDSEVDAIVSAGVPTVLIDAFHPDLPRVTTDDVHGGELATRHLLELGHRRIGFIGDDEQRGLDFVSSRLRWSGHRAALQHAGIDDLHATRELRRLGPSGRASAAALTADLLALADPPTAIFAASDLQALGVLQAAEAAGVEVPGQLSVIGFDDLEVARDVGLTTVSQPLRESGRRGMRRLLALLEGATDSETPQEEQLTLTLEVRRSTGPVGAR